MKFSELKENGNTSYRLSNGISVVKIPTVQNEHKETYNAISIPSFMLVYVSPEIEVSFADGPVGFKQH